MPKRYLLCDRDGTLIVEKNYLSDPEGVEVISGVGRALKAFNDAGWGIAVVTNQAGVGRGYYGVEQMNSVNLRVQALLAEDGVRIDGFFACIHAPDADCSCRKPKPGLVFAAVQALDFDPRDSIVVGDKACDVELGQGVGAKGVLVRTGYGMKEEQRGDLKPDLVIDSLADLHPTLFY